jgi:L-asparagine transporter-like permease
MSELSRSLQPRHVTMISIGGIIGAGLFVGSSASIAATGPAIVLSYLITGTLVLLVMRMLGEMAVALPAVRSLASVPGQASSRAGCTGISGSSSCRWRRSRERGSCTTGSACPHGSSGSC